MQPFYHYYFFQYRIGELYITGTSKTFSFILHIRYVFQYRLAADSIILILIFLQKLKQGNKDAAILLVGIVILFITLMHAITVALGFFTRDIYIYVHWGLFILLLSLSIVLIRSYTLLQKKIVLSKADMNIAQNIQQSIIPANPPNQGKVIIASEYILAEIFGGDFFDYAPITKQEIGIIIADITGHNVSAALIASMCKIAFRASSDVFTNP
ncbi:MAG: PP2C family protein-serine/threonine phosphatase [Spirochaetota bacterium]